MFFTGVSYVLGELFLSTTLILDILVFTNRAGELGDRRWRKVLDRIPLPCGGNCPPSPDCKGWREDCSDRGAGLRAGINVGDMAKIFQAFYMTRPDGIGVGLAIRRFIVDLHGSRLEVYHNSHGGPTFAFTLLVGDDGP